MCNWGGGESVRNRSFQYSMKNVIAEGMQSVMQGEDGYTCDMMALLCRSHLNIRRS